MATNATADYAIHDPDIYVDGPPFAAFADLRRADPVHWQERDDEPSYWAIMKHADIRLVSSQPERFSCWEKGVSLNELTPQQLDVSRNMLTNMDPPQHAAYRAPFVSSFMPGQIARLGDRIREISRGIFSRAQALMEEHGAVEFVHEVCSPLPTQVFGELAGLPRESWDRLHDLAGQLTRSQDPDVVQSDAEKQGAGAEMLRFAVAFGNERRAAPPREDLTSLMLDGDFGGKPLSEFHFGTHFSQFIVAGNETTVTLLSSGLQALLDHPDQLAELRADPSLLPRAIEEMLRFANPLHYLGRTAKVDVELRGKRIRAGDRVAVYYTSGNRDEDVFADPERFDIHRSPNPHLTFGYANHFCLGAHLARLEARIFFEELLATFPRIEAAGPVRRLRSNFNNALKSFPVALARA